MNDMMPNNADLEMTVFSACMQDREQLEFFCRRVEVDDFYIIKHKKVFLALLRLFREDIKCDIVTLHTELKREGIESSASLLSQFLDLPFTEDPEYVVRELRGLANKRRVIEISNAAIKRALDPGADSADAVSYLQSNTEGISQYGKAPKTARTIQGLSEDSFDRYDEVAKNPGRITGVTTGYRALDFKFGGLRKRSLNVLAARPSMGKTALAGAIVRRAAAAGYKVAMFELEMSSDQLWDRLIAAETGIQLDKFMYGPLTTEDFDKITVATERLHELPIIFDDDSSVTPAEIYSRCEKYSDQLGGLDLVVVDHLQLIPVDGREKDRNSDIGKITRFLKGHLAKKLDVSVLLLSQLNRGLEQRHPPIPILSDLRESGNIEQDADTVTFIFRPRYYHLQEAYDNEAQVIVSKARQGSVGIVPMVFRPELTRFDGVTHG